ncbi:galactose-1-phosphate uridylyltransferase [Pyrinomonas methylaliphatogenes]|uniref:Galactose-1-phosphate uridylyltransferase n=2 Tax=Pyrinomonas methylaliphatogenes TaxID=454194 RepID=A0A0B6WUU1_9BACT|nr:galactose-1-phosphate uridylyltransferase [Pyrinomonas methylaliphatogenes]CDM64831.1 UTP-hexose-1-phosphate uridylyltransferase /UDP-glucose-hexose-1-phosphate uridylyltransferase [Pyrinomonas methylaliphatogenes]
MVWEERWHPLREEWVIVAAHRQSRPWQGETVAEQAVELPAYVADCYLCPGNVRASGVRNPHYVDTFVFENDFPCVAVDAPAVEPPPVGFYRNRAARGIARVVCYSPKHNVGLAELDQRAVERLLVVWQEQYRELGALAGVEHVLIFENKGEVVGVSNPHPHGQIYATNFVFKTIEQEVRASERYWRERGRGLFEEVIRAEQEDGRRIIYENEGAIVFIPYFARYAYETYVAPKRRCASVSDLRDGEVGDFAAALREILVRYDNLWRMPFPYVLVLHQAPTDGGDYRAFHFHIEIHPPLRQPHLLKYLAGPEIGGGNFLSDTAPEEKAAELRALSNVHYKRARS